METIRPDDFRCNFCVEIRKETPGRTPNGRLSRFPSLVRGRCEPRGAYRSQDHFLTFLSASFIATGDAN
ncbi:hypothetical protein [Burkholderia ambifaria]|uniref:hypothetical protein n=1 Tax=Burkholderia ambifaria TaxID=152480 RepID=UPI00158877C3|nr:hypothetical protein [Burkholderia ambifaria]